MAIGNFNPVIWSRGFLSNLNKAHVHASLLNRDYEGEIKAQGDSVKISSIGRVTVRDYTRNSGLGGTAASPTITAIARPEILQGSSLFLTISEAEYFNFAMMMRTSSSSSRSSWTRPWRKRLTRWRTR